MRLTVLLLFALAARAAAAEKAPTPLTAQELEVIWQDRFIQHDEDGSRQALRDVRRLIASPQLTLPFLKTKLKPVPTVDQARITAMVADLDSATFDARENAMKELEALGVVAGPALEKKLKEQAPLEVRQRLETLLKRIDGQGLSVADLRSLRGIEVLEGIGTAEAKTQLTDLAKGGAGHVITARAQQALANLAGRAK